MTMNRHRIHAAIAHMRGLLNGEAIARIERQQYRGAKIVTVTVADGRQAHVAVFQP